MLHETMFILGFALMSFQALTILLESRSYLPKTVLVLANAAFLTAVWSRPDNLTAWAKDYPTLVAFAALSIFLVFLAAVRSYNDAKVYAIVSDHEELEFESDISLAA